MKDTSGSEADWVYRKKLALNILEEMRLDRRKKSLRRLCIEVVAPLSLTLIGIVVSIHGDVISENRSGLRTLLWGPPQDQRVNLSDLMSDVSGLL